MTAVQQWERGIGARGQSGSAISIFDKVMWAFRCGFSEIARDIASWDVQCELADALGVDINAIEKSIREGTAFARLAADYQDADKMRIEGSPSFVLNEGRQKLYGDVGFRIIEANIQELLRAPGDDQASCADDGLFAIRGAQHLSRANNFEGIGPRHWSGELSSRLPVTALRLCRP